MPAQRPGETQKTRARSDGRILLTLGILVLLFFGAIFKDSANDSMVDFKAVYYGARSLLHHHDAYDPAAMSELYRTQYGESDFIAQHKAMVYSVYFPATFFILAPIAMLPWSAASGLWSAIMLASLIAAGLAIWRIGAEHAPILSGGLIGLALANGAVVLANGNPAGIVVGLCVIAGWSLSQERWVWVGIFCLVASFAIKPQDAGFIWLFFLLRPGAFRKRALQTAAITALLAIVSGWWAWRLAPRWLPELRANLAAVSVRGGNSDPGPAGLTSRTGTMEAITDLQTVLSVARDEPVFYDSITYLVCGVLLAVWLIGTVMSRKTTAIHWTALAVIAPLTLLVNYHRAYDARILLLCIPACAMLWAKGGPVAKFAVALTTLAFVFTGEFFLALLSPVTAKLHLGTGTIAGKLGTILLMRLPALTLLAVCLFYLWIYMRDQHSGVGSATQPAGDCEAASAGRL